MTTKSLRDGLCAWRAHDPWLSTRSGKSFLFPDT